MAWLAGYLLDTPAHAVYVGKVSSSIGSTVTYTAEYIAHVTEYAPELLHLLGL